MFNKVLIYLHTYLIISLQVLKISYCDCTQCFPFKAISRSIVQVDD